MGPATERTLTRLTLLFADHGITDRADRLRLCADHVGRLVRTMKDLSQTEAHDLIVRLDALPRNGGVKAAADRLAAAILAANRDPMEDAVAALTDAGLLPAACGYCQDEGRDVCRPGCQHARALAEADR